TVTVIPNIFKSRSTSICNGDSIMLGGSYRKEAGSYQDVFLSAAGCDSTVTTNLNIIAADTSVNTTGSILTANASGATYQWIDCDNNNTPLPGATGQSFAPSTAGHYAVIVTQNGCTGVSSCYAVTPSSVLENNFPTAIMLYPNPARNQISIEL